MAEQLGSVFVECENNHMHCSNYSDIIIRRPYDFSVANVGERGLIQLQSLLPTSYPGHSILTEDEGEILGVDNCACGRKGKYFKIYGRIKGAELRGAVIPMNAVEYLVGSEDICNLPLPTYSDEGLFVYLRFVG